MKSLFFLKVPAIDKINSKMKLIDVITMATINLVFVI